MRHPLAISCSATPWRRREQQVPFGFAQGRLFGFAQDDNLLELDKQLLEQAGCGCDYSICTK